MCGRYALTSSGEALAALLGAAAASDFAPRYNISPGQTVQACARENGERLLAGYRWGVASGSTQDGRPAPLHFNARAETAAQKPGTRSALQNRRCLVPADAWYEWKTLGRFKQPYLIRRADRGPMMFAGLWESPRGGERAGRSLVILTAAATRELAPIHARMPAVLAPEHWEAWLDLRVDGVSLAMRCLGPAPAGSFVATPISARINQIHNDGPEVQEPAPEPIAAEPSQPRPV